ncbi:MAG: metallophosphoesterase [Verrucomicrobiales bacterium]|nr:metallophosphoesterase [Verrucomicrobiales bacterium]MDF1787970.1 metallophosphoesterase [Verrucomicrobiales bacterium]
MKSHPSSNRRRFIQTSSLWLGATLIHGQDQAPKAPPLIRIGVVTDLHYAEKRSSGSRHYQESTRKLTEAVALFQQEKPDFVIELGDLVDVAPTAEQEIKFLKAINAIFEKVDCPRHYVLGNHCVATLTKEQFYQSCGATKSGYYSWDQNGVHFIILDACYQKDLKDYRPGNFEWSDTNIPPVESAWLAKDLKSTTLPTVAFVHQRLDLEPGTSPYAIKQSLEVRKILEESGQVRAVFQGHSHKHELHQIGDIAYCTIAAMVEGSGATNNSYAMLEIYKDGAIQLKGFRKQETYKIPA